MAAAETNKSQQELSKSQTRKRERLEKRAKSRPHLKFKNETNVLYNKLLNAKKAGGGEAEQQQILVKLLEHIEPRIEEVHTRDDASTSRALQACLKYGKKKQAQHIIEKLAGVFSNLAGRKYGHKLATKMLLYADKPLHHKLCNALLGQRDIFFSKFGSRVWEYAYINGGRTATQQRQMLYSVLIPSIVKLKLGDPGGKPFEEVFGAGDDATKVQLFESTSKFVQKAVDKELLDKVPVHTALKWIITHTTDGNKLEELLERILEGAVHLCQSKAGTECLVRLLGYATAKQRKTFVKTLKGKVVDLCKSEVGYVLIMRLLETVDDTRLIAESLLKEMKSELRELCFHKYGHKVILQVLAAGVPRYLTERERMLVGLPSPMSLKDAAIRRASHLDALRDSLGDILLQSNKDSTLQIRPKKKAKTVGGEGQDSGTRAGDAATLCAWLSDCCARDVLLAFCGHSGLQPTADIFRRLKEMLDSELAEGPTRSCADASCFHHIVGHRTIQLVLCLGGSEVAAGLYGSLLRWPSSVEWLLRGRGVFVLKAVLDRVTTNCEAQTVVSVAQVDEAVAELKHSDAAPSSTNGLQLLRDFLTGADNANQQKRSTSAQGPGTGTRLTPSYPDASGG
eukprot:GHVQ01023016.1.p1 GENE.GHVQ01023016.1~~GHVQ01023016.1.p1  ORF type:complete len:624 (+),score=97.21 GHVQ01023016.1:149-2020(+)